MQLIAEKLLESIEVIGTTWESIDLENDGIGIEVLLDAIESSFNNIYDLENTFNAVIPINNVMDSPKEILLKIIDYLIIEFISKHHSKIYHILLGLGAIINDAEQRQSIVLSKLLEVIKNPFEAIRNSFENINANFDADYIIALLYGALNDFANTELINILEEDFSSNAIRISIVDKDDPLQTARIYLFITGFTTDTNGIGIRLSFHGDSNLDFNKKISDAISFSLNSTLKSSIEQALELTFDGVKVKQLMDGTISKDVTVQSKLKYKANSVPHTLFSFPDFGSITYSRMEIEFKLNSKENKLDYDLKFSIKDINLSIIPTNTDGFLSTILPENGINSSFDFAFGYHHKKGLYFENGTDLSVILTLYSDAISKLLDVRALKILAAIKDQHFDIQTLVEGNIKLGPLQLTVSDLGLEMNLGRKDLPFTFNTINLPGLQNENYGLNLSFAPPKQIGFIIDTGAVTGGGYLSLNAEKGEYSGMLQLEFAKIGLNAIGILSTKMPDGSKGYSLLLIITAEFTPAIQLGFGFSLLKVGGLFGAHRQVEVEIMKEGFRSNSLESILLPHDPINNAPAIISKLGSVFPVTPNRYIFGPMASITWGTPKILTIDLGLLIETPVPLRVILLGRIRMALPTEKAALIKINLNMLGKIDFGEQTIEIDASLFDSYFTAYTLSGDMAMRMNYGNKPMFALSIGGMHPSYKKPSGFPTLNRVAISLSSGNNPRLRLEAYLALTSNTVQLGARLDLYAAAGNWNLSGTLGFDALIQFSPFYFIVDIYGSVALKRKSKHIMGLSVAFSLSGPNQWRANGKATFKILFFKGSISFNMTVGEKKQEALPTTEIWPILKTALESDNNWSVQLPKNGHTFVVFKDESANKVHPLGVIEFRQQIVPFNLEIQKFGNTQPLGANKFMIHKVEVASTASTASEISVISETKEHFAPAQFIELSEEEKLSRPSFERFTAGAQVQSSKVDTSTHIAKGLIYDQIIVDNKMDIATVGLKLHSKFQLANNRNIAALNTGIHNSGFERYKSAPIGISLRDKKYTITDKKTMKSVGFVSSSYTEAAQFMNNLEAEGNYQVVELNTL